MCTYSHKKPECQLLENVHELCRLCLTKSDYVVPIFDNKNDNNVTTLPIRIMICIGIEVTPEENLPNIICKDCYQQIQNIASFRKKCEISSLQLKSHLIAVKQNLLMTLKTEHEGQVLDQVEKKTDETISIVFDNDEAPGVLVETKEGLADECGEKIKDREKVSVRNDTLEQTVGIKVQSDEKCSSPDISAFLSMVLLELGILSQHNDKLAVVEPNMKSLSLETGDDEVTLELVEENDEDDNIQIYHEDKSDIQDDMSLDITERTPLEQDMQMEYVQNDTTTFNNTASTEKFDANSSTGMHCCATCGASFASRGALAQHSARHSGLRPHACDQCPRRFTQRETMLRHRLIHQDVRFKCSVCPKSFTQSAALSMHARSHRPPPRLPMALHRCSRCPMMFLYASGLSRHMMWHNGRPFKSKGVIGCLPTGAPCSNTSRAPAIDRASTTLSRAN